MAVNQNRETQRELQKGLGMQPVHDGVINNIANQISPVYVTNPNYKRVVKSDTAFATSSTLFTTPTDKDFFITSAYLLSADAATTGGSITVTIDGASVNLITIITSTGTGIGGHNITYNDILVKVDRGTNIVLTAGAANVASGGIVGFIDEGSAVI